MMGAYKKIGFGEKKKKKKLVEGINRFNRNLTQIFRVIFLRDRLINFFDFFTHGPCGHYGGLLEALFLLFFLIFYLFHFFKFFQEKKNFKKKKLNLKKN